MALRKSSSSVATASEMTIVMRKRRDKTRIFILEVKEDGEKLVLCCCTLKKRNDSIMLTWSGKATIANCSVEMTHFDIGTSDGTFLKLLKSVEVDSMIISLNAIREKRGGARQNFYYQLS